MSRVGVLAYLLVSMQEKHSLSSHAMHCLRYLVELVHVFLVCHATFGLINRMRVSPLDRVKIVIQYVRLFIDRASGCRCIVPSGRGIAAL